MDTLGESTAWAALGLAALGCFYAIAAAVVVRRFGAVPRRYADAAAGVTILKPLSGSSPALYDDLASFCDQDFRGSLQILFGVQDATDAATAVVRRLISARPGVDLELVVHAPIRGANPKVANLTGLERHIRHPVVILADADIRVSGDYVREIVDTLNEPGVGAATCLYRGADRAGIWARLCSMGIDYHFLPNVLMGLKLGLARPCFGSTIALRRETLQAIGGFQAFRDCLADDYTMGAAIRAKGMRVAIPKLIVTHSCYEKTVVDLFGHELRWARTIRAVDPSGYAGLMITQPLPFALLGAALNGFSVIAIAIVAAAIASRLVLQCQVDHTLNVPPDRWWLMPLRDLLAFGIYVAGFFVNVVRWGGRRYRVRPDGTLTALGEPNT
ncbi:MAG TPA: bacteriohopanetetrol glucosamine biosynthesis glycosyltransferase HpnI [Casimicrobiaceae bacterium]|nr:bacteriohopanetetrol glucosamine biosynthesis glycosyltransferase HpnI [Casimicrobiaceae bacterium]